MKLFITGSGTDVGKTYFSSLLLKHWTGTAAKGSIRAFKPISCGDLQDAQLLSQAMSAKQESPMSAEQISPWLYKNSLSPLAASLIEGWEVDIAKLIEQFNDLAERSSHLIVEGAGGWEVPILKDYRVSDLAAQMNLPVVLVIDNRLGALNETILSLEAISHKGLDCAGLILNHPREERDAASVSNRVILETLYPELFIGELLHGESELPLEIAEHFS